MKWQLFLGTDLINGRQVIPTRGEVGRHGRKVGLSAYLEYYVHSYDDMEQEVTVEKPEARVSGSETEDDVSVIRDGDGILRWGKVSLFKMTLKQASPVQIQSMLQVDLLHVLIGRSADTDDVESVSVQVERVR